MKRTSKCAFLFSLLLLIPAIAIPHRPVDRSAEPFEITIVDQHGLGVLDLRLTTDNGIVCHTRSDGTVTWTESSLMDRNVFFGIEGPGVQFPGGGKTIRVTHGGHAELKISR